MEAGAFVRDLAAGRIPRLVLLHGPEPLLIEELLERLAESLRSGPEAAACDREVMWADAVDPDQLIAAAADLPLLGGRRLVVLRGLGEAPAKTVDRLRAAIDGARARPGGWPAEATTVALVAAGSPRRGGPPRIVGDAEQVEARPPVGRMVPAWLRDRARRMGLDLLPEAAQLLITLSGEDLGQLQGELEKAAAYVGSDGRVTEDVVRALSTDGRVRQYWELAQALETGDAAASLRVLEALLRSGEEPLAILAQVVAHVRDVWRAHAGVARRLPAAQVAGLFPRRRPEWAIERLMARAAGWGADGLAEAVARCFDTEQRLKSGGGAPRGLLTSLVEQVARAAPGRPATASRG
jgi:DNA polymerase-3 subunit delta